MAAKFNLTKQDFNTLLKGPEKPLEKNLNGVSCHFQVAIPEYGRKIADHYADQVGGDFSGVCQRASLPFTFSSFGLVAEFDDPLEIELYDADQRLYGNVKDAIAQFGILIFRNAYLATKFRGQGQKNIFPDLNFHVDRGSNQENLYSLFCRDPFDPIQKEPRKSSTLVIANIVAYLQSLKEGQDPAGGQQTLYSIFKDTDLEPLIDAVLLEQPWSAPEGTGEICVFDNRTVLHASYYRSGQGYPIGVRYLF